MRIPACQAFWIKSRASGVFELHSNMAVGTEGAILTVSAIVAVLAALIIVMAALFMVVEMTRSSSRTNESVPDHLITFLREIHNSRSRLRLVLHPGAWLQYKEDSMEETRVEEWFQDLLEADHVKSKSLTAKQD